MVDYTAAIPDAGLLGRPPFRVAKGGRRIITLPERGEVLAALQDAGCDATVTPGGSLANTLVGVARLAAAHGHSLRIRMAGSTSNDPLGSYFNAQLGTAGVDVIVDPELATHTGTVMVLTTPDAQRSFLSFFDSSAPRLTPRQAAAVSSARVVVIEGYLLELPGAGPWLERVARQAAQAGAQVVLTAGDPTVVARHRSTLRRLLSGGLVDVLFCNKEEAGELLAPDGSGSYDASSGRAGLPLTADLANALAEWVRLAVVTDGPRGACLCTAGQPVVEVPPHWAPHGPVDVCGAGDAFAAGVVYGTLCGYDLATAGAFAARCAAAVIGHHGAQLEAEDAAHLVLELPDHVPVPLYA